MVLAIWLLHHDQYVWQDYSECYNRDVQVHITLKIKSRKFLFKEKFTNPQKFQPQNIPAIWYGYTYMLYLKQSPVFAN